MTPERNNDVYNHPQSEEELNQEPSVAGTQNSKAEQNTAVNPNPRANENLGDKKLSSNENVENNQAGSEITDGEDG
jgi:hypothetical protein